jgi:hypothetical protein
MMIIVGWRVTWAKVRWGERLRKNFHESYGPAETKPPSERSTGLVFAAVALIVAVLWRNTPNVPWVALSVAGVLALISIAAPKVLKPLNLIWFQIGLLLHRVVNPVVMFAMFAVVFVPAGLIMRIWHDPLRSRRTKRSASTYWIDRTTGAQGAGSMTNQF